MIVVQSEVLFKIYSSKFSSAYPSYSVKYKFLLQCKTEISVFFISIAAEGWGDKEVCTKGVCDRQKEGEGRRWARGITLA